MSKNYAVIGVLSALALTMSVHADGAGWVSLFDGKTLNGWIQKNGTATYRVEDGAIVGKTTKGSPNSFLCTEQEYGDFELEFEVRILNNELNSGVQIRSQTAPAKGKQKFGRVNGPQVDIGTSDSNVSLWGFSGYIYGEACGGWMTPADRRKQHKLFKDGQWNKFRIVARGARIQTWINGTAVEDLTDNEKFKTHPKGFIGLQVHSVGNRGPFEVAWRNIRIAEQIGETSRVDRPNFILIVCDNLGYGDIGCYGSKLHRTPHIDRMAAEGMRFTDYYIAPVCTLSRASIMTGCYAPRVGMNDYPGAVLRPASPEGLHPDEITVAEVLKERGYATAIIGKWHLGDQPEFLPTRQGFDYWLGIPYSDNMDASKKNFPPLPLMENERVIEAPPDRNLLTKRYTEKVIELITKHKDEPFFIYVPQAMPGSTSHSFASEEFREKSANGLYGDMIEELDWSMGRILNTLKKLNLNKRTLVIWSSDNGAWRPLKGGSNAPLSGWLGSTMEGSMRVPCVMWWPGTIPAGKECRELITAMDFLPTFGRLAEAKIPDDRIIDGHDIRPLMFGQADAKSPYEAFYYYYKAQLHAVRSGKWKLHVPLEKKIGIGVRRSCPVMLNDLENDIGEKTNLADKHPDVVKRLMDLAEKAREDLGDLGRPGKNCRPVGKVSNPTPRLIDTDTHQSNTGE